MDKKKKSAPLKLLFLYASAGTGHKQAALALKKVCDQGSIAETEAIDILDYSPQYFKKLYSEGYLEVVKTAPDLWGYLYDRAYQFNKATVVERMHHIIGNLHIRALLDYVKKFSPDAIVFSHFLGFKALSSLRKSKAGRVPFYCVVTDYAVHPIWISQNVDRYYVASEGEKRTLKSHKFTEEQIEITGIPVDPSFSQQVDVERACKNIGFDPNIPKILIIAGHHNQKEYENMLRSFSGVKQELQIIALAGKHKTLKRKFEEIGKGLLHKVNVYGMVDNMHELMSLVDIVISKPGGLTTSEVLASKTLMGIVDPIPGQEQRNTDYLLENGVGIRIHDMANAGIKIGELLYDKSRLSVMRSHLKWVSKPRACFDIIDDIVSSLRLKS
ncbi:MAG: glycosyltransferase [Candidatus Omnitrophota bacterium]